jgi:hypothetical protein
MMKFLHTIQDWSALRKPDIDITSQEDRSFTWKCPKCSLEVSVPLRSRLHVWDMFPAGDFTPKEREEVKRHYAMGSYSRSPCGGGIHFEKISCPSCSARFLFSYGVHEPSNSYLILTTQGVVEIEEDTPRE